jgi:hypothetical protein
MASTNADVPVDAQVAADPGCRSQDKAHQRVAAAPSPVDALCRGRANRLERSSAPLNGPRAQVLVGQRLCSIMVMIVTGRLGRSQVPPAPRSNEFPGRRPRFPREP